MGLIVSPGESCTYPGTSAEFSVDSSGTGRFLFFTAGTGIDARNTTINGVTYNFKASKQGDGTWIIEAAGDSQAQAPTATPTRAQSASDRAVLVALYHSTDGASWDANTNWLSDRPIGEWHGVATNSNGRVIELDILGNNLTGEIPPELGRLSNLTLLDLGSNQLTGEIPPELGRLSNLTELVLYGNQLTGEIPPELGRLSNLTYLHLDSNGLTGEIPPELGGLSNLKLLDLYGNQLTGEIPPELGDLSNLTRLYLDYNQLTGEIPPELGGLSYLTDLVLYGNQLTGEIPPELGRLSNLVGLWLYGNRLTGEIPPELGRLSYLTWLWLTDNQLTGEIPPELGRLSYLTELHLDSNGLTGEIPPELGGLSNLTLLDLDSNQLTGEIPPELGRLSNLTGLYLDYNQLTGEIPPELGRLSNLTELDLDYNQLTGEIPPELGRQSNLTLLDLGSNQLTGAIPPELGGLSNLTELVLYGNQLTGEIPPELGRLSNLTWLWLTDNQLTGEIPPELGRLSNLTWLWLTDNQLTGEIPPELGRLSNLTWLWLTDNQLTGEIPPELGRLSNLTWLWLTDNQLTGEIPPELGRLSNLTELHLDSNGLTGEIPPELGGLSNLKLLDLGSNQLTGEIPPELGRLSNLTELVLYGNQLTGEIPPELGRLSNLTYLHLDSNGLTGEIPPELGGLSNLWSLSLKVNQLTGEIPPELGRQSNLTELHLDSNGLTGEIPPELGRQSNLTELHLDSNGLTGEIPPELGRQSNLTLLDLGSNQLTGEIPPELGRLSNLTELGLGSNQLTGEIPPELGRLSNLTWLWLTDNQLTGEIPPELGRLSKLTWLFLHGNQLTGCIPEGLRDIAENDLVELNLPDCGAATPTPTVVSLEIAGMTPLTSIGETVRLSATANMSDGSRRDVESGLVQWQSSDPWVASVSEGIVTAVRGGNAVITATYEGRNVEALVSVRISTRSTGTVRVLYAIPSDREFRADSSEAIANFIVDLQSWYRRELGGLTFSIYEATPQECRMSEPADFYGRGDAWAKVVEGVQHCAPVQHDHPDFVWVVYVDVEEACDEPQELGAGGWGLTILPDIKGITSPGKDLYSFCGEGPFNETPGRWIGGLGHELGHTLRLPHPPGCDPWDPATCDDLEALSLMHDGYASYPDTYLLPDDKEILIRSSFIGGEPAPARNSLDAPNESSVQGVALRLDGEPVEGLRVSLVAESFWNWGETGRAGTFEIRLPEGSSGPSILSIHAGDAGGCGWLGYYGPDGITTLRTQATQVKIGDGNVTGIEIQLPVNTNDLCPGQRKVTGVVLGPDGRPVEGIWLGAVDGWLRTGVDGTFEFPVPEGWVGSSILSIHADEVPDCGMVGYYGPGGFTTRLEDAWLEIGGLGATGIEIRLPATPDDLCSRQITVSVAVLGPDGEPVAGIWIELAAEAFWLWGHTGQDGTFEIRLLDGWSGSAILSIHAGEVADCDLVGYYGPGGFPTLSEEATRVAVGDADVTGIEIRLPASPDELCNRQGYMDAWSQAADQIQPQVTGVR